MAYVRGGENDLAQDSNTSFESTERTALDPRSYQIEMFEASMKENIIVAMATGSGKTLVARLRIEAELQRTPSKARVLCTHSLDDATLMSKQHRFFCTQMPSYSFRLITGMDNVQFWSTQKVWDSALAGQQVVVSTPEVLRAALEHGFVSLGDISLLVFDEAHHCMKNHPTNLIMKQCPVARNNIEAMQELEQNLNAVCRSPTLNLEDYESFVHMPQLLPLSFDQSPTQCSRLLSVLRELVDGYNIFTDPLYIRLSQSTSLQDKVRFDEILQKNKTPILGELKRLLNQATHLEEQIGAWAADNYITTCVSTFRTMHHIQPLITLRNQESMHLLALLSSIHNPSLQNPTGNNISGKCLALISYLAENRGTDKTCIVFVERRATAWALRELIACWDPLSAWKPFALVGVSSREGQGLADLVDQQMPSAALEDFREGSLNLCIATSVLEEGIDVQACNLVICFDDSQNVKSFIQRRGRARRPGSKYVILQDSTSGARTSMYQALEDQMTAAYADVDRQINELEGIDEVCTLHYEVPSTGAYLTIDQARAHLAHFCNLLPHREGRSTPAPIYIMNGIPGKEFESRDKYNSSLQRTTSFLRFEESMMQQIARSSACDLNTHDEAVLSSALTAPGVAQTDYQRLEFIGDSLLKYWATIHMFCLHPDMPENLLTNACHRLVNNARLQQATRDLGLDAYFSNTPFSARKWSLEQKPEFREPRVISSKTLADIIEALIGVAYADFEHAPLNPNSQRIQRALGLFLPSIPWRSPSTLIGKLKTRAEAELAGCLSIPNNDQFTSVENILGYSFTNKATLLTALTHSTAQVGLETYERLEFLGDAIIDIIVKQRLWHSPLELSEGQMTARHASLVNKDIFAYITTKLAVEKEINEVNVDPHTKQVHLAEKRRRICLHDFMLKLPDREFMERRERFMQRFEQIQERLDHELSTGQQFPWTELYHLNAPKWCSDILESIVGAVYIDSGASLETCEVVLARIGLMELVSRAAGERDIIYLQPLTRLRMLSPYLEVQDSKRREGGEGPLLFDCRLLLEKKELGSFAGASCKPEAQNMAAEIVLEKIAFGEITLAKNTSGVVKKDDQDQDDGDPA
ncbi:hypothetical protein DV735_g2680, partial [Chaetothyriales sp. CBS 134920]